MASKTAIEWTETTWNPTTGCDRVSPGCDHCYAMTLAKRLKAMGNPRYQNDGRPETSGPGFGVTIHPDKLDEPLHWRKPTVVFVNSMSDLFHAEIPREFIAEVFAVMALTPQHTYQVLTKRPGRMRLLLTSEAWWDLVETAIRRRGGGVGFVPLDAAVGPWPTFPNVWLGTSVEDQEHADKRIPELLRVPAAIRFLSCEPLLGPVTLVPDHVGGYPESDQWTRDRDAGAVPLLNWVIVGGESGHGYRPIHLEWVRTLRDECTNAGVAFFLKQWGGHTPKAGGRELDGRTWDEMPIRTSARLRTG